MKRAFESATIKLTAWYLAILMVICLFFSVIIYQTSSSELETRVQSVAQRYSRLTPRGIVIQDYSESQLHEARLSLVIALVYSNMFILLLGGAGSFILARRTLKPIEEAQEAEARFISDASHELRTPLAVMKSELEVALRDKKLDHKDAIDILESNLEEVNRLAGLSNMLLKLARNQIGSKEMSAIDARPLIDEVIRHFEKLGVTRIDTSDLLRQIPIHADPDSIRELITILLENAIRYSPDDTPITVSAAAKRDSTIILLRNHGEGIIEADLPYIFDRSYRGEKSRNQAAGGYGLGLSLAKKIVLLHQGTISISSRPGDFTLVSLELPKNP